MDLGGPGCATACSPRVPRWGGSAAAVWAVMALRMTSAGGDGERRVVFGEEACGSDVPASVTDALSGGREVRDHPLEVAGASAPESQWSRGGLIGGWGSAPAPAPELSGALRSTSMTATEVMGRAGRCAEGAFEPVGGDGGVEHAAVFSHHQVAVGGANHARHRAVESGAPLGRARTGAPLALRPRRGSQGRPVTGCKPRGRRGPPRVPGRCRCLPRR